MRKYSREFEAKRETDKKSQGLSKEMSANESVRYSGQFTVFYLFHFNSCHALDPVLS